MFIGDFYKWEKLEENAWAYGPSVLEERPLICRVVPASNPEPARPIFYRAEFGRPPLPFVAVGRDRDRVSRARADARHFMSSHFSYENLVNLYTERLDSRFPQRENLRPDGEEAADIRIGGDWWHQWDKARS